jgi:hypothetical protein
MSFGRSQLPEWVYSPEFGNAIRFLAVGMLLTVVLWMLWLVARSLYRAWFSRRSAFLTFRDAAAKLYENTKAADLLSDSGLPASPDARIGYHAYQYFAAFGKATFYGKKTPSNVMEPVPKADICNGKRADDMCSWITENGVEYANLSLRRDDLRRVTALVRRAVKEHNALLARARRRSPDDED